MFYIILFFYCIRLEVTHARVLIIDYDHSKLSKELREAFSHSRYFDSNIFYGTEQEALHKIKQAKADILIIIPEDFDKRLRRGLKESISIYIDGAFPSRAQTMSSYVKGVLLNQAQRLFPKGSLAILLNERKLFNQAMRDEYAIVPGLFGLILLVAPAILSALLIVKEKEEGTIFNFYTSSLTKLEFLLAKLIPAFLLQSINIFILFLWATWLFNLPFRGSFTLYFFASELYILISLGIGLLVSIITKTQIVAIVLTIIITIIPAFLYSGMLMPISSMSGESVLEAHLYPVMYYNHIIYDTFLIGQGIKASTIYQYLIILGLYALGVLGLGMFLLKKELK